ncbi:MAG: thioredoxin family protein [Cyanothece sp. SIO1E1]|nr:thioredoxin family protein [Cyanothece sp. SIO1E1]
MAIANTGTPIGSYAPDFELPGTDGSVHHLARYLDKFRIVCVVFMCNHCPYVRAYLNRLKQIQADFYGQGITLIGINANDANQYPDDSFENMRVFADDHQLNFPYLRDVTQDVALSFGAEKTPQVFLVDQSGVLRYSGLVDDNSQNPQAVQSPYLRDAIGQLLNRKAITPTSTPPMGCSVKWRQ